MEVRKLAPWEWMPDFLITGFEMPDRETPYFTTVFGYQPVEVEGEDEEEDLGIIVLRGTAALARLLALMSGEKKEAPRFGSSTFEISHLKLRFLSRNELDEEDLEIIRAANMRFRGKRAHPEFRTVRPGMWPDLPDADELEILCAGMEHILAVAPRFREDDDLISEAIDDLVDLSRILMRVPARREADKTEWWEATREFDLEDRPIVPDLPDISPDSVLELQRLPLARKNESGEVIVVDLRPLRLPTADSPEDRMFFLYALTIADGVVEEVLDYEVMEGQIGPEAIVRHAAEVCQECFTTQLEVRPRKVVVPNQDIAALVSRICKPAGIPVVEGTSDYLDEVYKNLEIGLLRSAVVTMFQNLGVDIDAEELDGVLESLDDLGFYDNEESE